MNKTNLMHTLHTECSLHHHDHEARTQLCIMQTECAGIQPVFREMNDYFVLVASEKMSLRKQHFN